MGNPDDAADGLQDGMVAAYRRAASFRGDAQVTTWLHRVVVNACLDRHRAARVRRTEVLPDDLEEYGGRGALLSSTASSLEPTDPADLTVREEQRAVVLAALATLPSEQRAALVLVDMEGYPVLEAAQMLDCAVGTVKSRCSRGRARLAVELAHLMPPAEAVGEVTSPVGNPPSTSAVPFPDARRGPPDEAPTPPTP